jgi:PAS domain S-box-containing protein
VEDKIFYKNLIKSAPFGYAYHKIILDENGKPIDYMFLEVNNSFEKLTGLKSENILNKKITDVIPDITKGDFDWISYYGDIALNGGEKEFEQYSFPLKKWYKVQVHSPQKLFFSTIFVDITEKIITEKKFIKTTEEQQILLDNIQTQVWYLTDDHTYGAINKAHADFNGVKKEDYEFKDMYNIFSKEIVEVCRLSNKKVFETGEPQYTEEWVPYKTGEQRLISIVKIPKLNNDGTVEYVVCSAEDITEKHNAELQLRKLKDQYESLVNNIPGITYRCKYDEKWTMIFMSTNTDSITGYSADELLNNKIVSYGELIIDADKMLVKNSIDTATKDKKPWEIEYQIKTKMGSVKWVYEKGRAIFNNNNEIEFLDGFILDISEQKRIANELKESELRYNLAIVGPGAGLWDWDMVKNKVYFSPYWKEMLGYNDEEIPNDFSSWKNLWHPVDAEKVEKAVHDHLAGKTVKYEIEHRLKCKDGSWRWILTRGDIIKDKNGKPIRWVGTNIDLTETKKVELELIKMKEQYELAINGTNDGIWDWYITTNNLFLSKRWKEILGYKDDELENNFNTFMKLLHENDKSRVNDYLQKYLTGIIKKYEIEFKMIHKNGSIRWILAKGEAIRDADGKPYRMAGSHSDITERKIAEEQLKKAKAQAESANKAKSEFLANMSHEIRTPLNSIIGFTDLLVKTPLNSTQKQYAENVNIAGHSLLGIINDILDFSKIEAGKLDLELLKTDIIQLTEEASDIIKYQAGRKGLELLLDIQPGIPRFAVVDALRLKQMLTNLLGNAVKFTEQGEIILKLEHSLNSQNESLFTFSVSDTGIGITEEQLKKLFKAFSQADTSTTRKYGGTGLGLVISNMLAEKMGSKISVKSEVAKGSTFYFTIKTESEYGEKIDYKNLDEIKNVLVIDDNANNRLILEHLFQGWNINFTGCDNGLDALKILDSSKHFDVIIVDYNMPYIDGLETIRLIRENLNLHADKQPVILLHSSSDDKYINICK